MGKRTNRSVWWALNGAVWGAVNKAMYWDVSRAVDRDVDDAVTGEGAVYRAVNWAVNTATGSPHHALQDFLLEALA